LYPECPGAKLFPNPTDDNRPAKILATGSGNVSVIISIIGADNYIPDN